jgi:hypothetical protein
MKLQLTDAEVTHLRQDVLLAYGGKQAIQDKSTLKRLAVQCGVAYDERLDRFIDLIRQASQDNDKARLDWLLHKISGKEFARIGIYYGVISEVRSLIDAAIDAAIKGKA